MKNIKLWTEEVKCIKEDRLLEKIVEDNGSRIWKIVSCLLHEKDCVRTAKQCRDRWTNYLKTRSIKSTFTVQERISAIEFFCMFGSQWSKLTDLIPGRTENQIKNFINSTIRRNIRHFNKGKLDKERIHSSSIEILKFTEVKDLLLTHKKISKGWYMDKFISDDILKKINQIKSHKEKERYIKLNQTENQVDDKFTNLEKVNLRESAWIVNDIYAENTQNLYQIMQSTFYWSTLPLNRFSDFTQ